MTFSCFRCQPFLSRNRARKWLVDAIALAQARHEFDLWAWVIMPEHVHLLVYPDSDEPTVGPMLSTIKQSVAKKAVAWARKEDRLECMEDVSPQGNVVHRFWQRGGGFDRNLWTPRRVWDVIDYIHQNPVERGLCERAENWEWSSARGFGEGGEKLVLEHRYLPVRRG